MASSLKILEISAPLLIQFLEISVCCESNSSRSSWHDPRALGIEVALVTWSKRFEIYVLNREEIFKSLTSSRKFQEISKSRMTFQLKSSYHSTRSTQHFQLLKPSPSALPMPVCRFMEICKMVMESRMKKFSYIEISKFQVKPESCKSSKF